MRASLMLADFAEAINGKLYIQGGGWSQVRQSGGAINFAVAAKVEVEWHEANRPLPIAFGIVDQDGVPLQPMEGQPFRIEAQLEAGRPAGMREGASINAPFTFRVDRLPIPAGVYRLEMTYDDHLLDAVTFEVQAEG